jgi:hypothetical protein
MGCSVTPATSCWDRGIICLEREVIILVLYIPVWPLKLISLLMILQRRSKVSLCGPQPNDSTSSNCNEERKIKNCYCYVIILKYSPLQTARSCGWRYNYICTRRFFLSGIRVPAFSVELGPRGDRWPASKSLELFGYGRWHPEAEARKSYALWSRGHASFRSDSIPFRKFWHFFERIRRCRQLTNFSLVVC